jgi:hypothetical protein
MRGKKLVYTLAASVILLTGLGSSGCSNEAQSELAMYPHDHLPASVQAAPLVVQRAYQFAAANPDVLDDIPCYCGCGSIGHTSNYACYVAGKDADGQPIFDTHALGCSICVDITNDTMRLMQQGRSGREIRTYIDSAYSKYGPSNIP